jgi:hypothetical protein
MPTSPNAYKRLTRPATSVGTYKSLWLGSDHLLFVTSTGYSEEYQSLRFREIMGFFVVPSDRRQLWSVPWSFVAVFDGIALINTLYNHNAPYVSGPLMGLCAIFLVCNFLLGPTCTVYAVTGVQTAPVPSLVRRAKARRVLARLKPIIASAQADIPVHSASPATPPPIEGAPPAI